MKADAHVDKKIIGIFVVITFILAGVLLLTGIGVYLCPDRTFKNILSFLYQNYRIYFYLIITLASNMLCFLRVEMRENIFVEIVYKISVCMVSIITAYLICNNKLLDQSVYNVLNRGHLFRTLLGLILSVAAAMAVTATFYLIIQNYRRAMHYVRKFKYEVFFFLFLFVEMILNNGGIVAEWSGIWYAMDYGNMGFASRLLPGTILSLLLHNGYVDKRTAYLFICFTMLLLYVIVSYLFGQCIRKSKPDNRDAVIYVILVYLASPGSIEYLARSGGRLEIFVAVFVLLFVIGYNKIQKPVGKCIYGCAMSFVYMACHQGGFFLFFPIVFTVLLMDILNSKLKKHAVFSAVIVGIANVSSFLMFQFFTTIKYGSYEEVLAVLKKHTNLDFTEALYYEYFAKVRDAYQQLTLPFLMGEDFPREKTFLLILVLSPMLIMIAGIWTKAYRNGKKSIYISLLLSDLIILPQFILNVDWERWIPAMIGVQFFQILYLAYKKDTGMESTMQGLSEFVGKQHFICLLLLIYLASFEKFFYRGYTGIIDRIFNILKTCVSG